MNWCANSPWDRPSTIEGFRRGAPNAVLLGHAARERRRLDHGRVGVALDIGCGAGRNAIPLAQAGWWVVGTDLSVPMLHAAREHASAVSLDGGSCFLKAPMDALPLRTGSCDLIVAHGIWNLARSAAEFRRAVGEAARVARPGAALFVFTFSRHTLPPEVEPVTGESFVYTQFSGEPQCFVTDTQLVDELRAAGFVPDPAVPLTEHNRPRPGQLRGPAAPVIYEAAFRRQPGRTPPIAAGVQPG